MKASEVVQAFKGKKKIKTRKGGKCSAKKKRMIEAIEESGSAENAYAVAASKD